MDMRTGLSTRGTFLSATCALIAAFASLPSHAQDQSAAPAPQLASDSSAALPTDTSADLLRAGVDETQLQPGEFVWLPYAEHHTDAPLVIIVNLSGQRAYVYRDGQPIAVTTVSTGRPGRETPIGTFEILDKERMHHSNRYDNAPMPFMQRLTWTGLSLHAGHLPGYPASHGCIRLPAKFAEQLYGLTERGETVVISDDASAEALARAELGTQIDPETGAASTIHQVVGPVGAAPMPDSRAAGSDGIDTDANDMASSSR